jgi:hypothetical protein
MANTYFSRSYRSTYKTEWPGAPVYRRSLPITVTEAQALGNGDIIKFFRLGETTPFAVHNAGVSWTEADEAATPTATATLRITNGTVTKNFLTALDLGADGFKDALVAAAAAAAVPAWFPGYYPLGVPWDVELVMTAANANPKSATFRCYVEYSHRLEDNAENLDMFSAT